MYRVYVLRQRKGGSEVLPATRTQTPSYPAACAAWWALHGADYDAQHLLLMSLDGRQVVAHRYRSQPGDRDHVAAGAELPREPRDVR